MLLLMIGAMVLVMIGTMALFRISGYVHWYFFLRHEETFRRLVCRFDKEWAFRMKALNIRSRDVLERAKSLPLATEENEERPMLEVLREVARQMCDEELDALENKLSFKYFE